jgi:hypothetical protein
MHKFRYERRGHGQGSVFIDGHKMMTTGFSYETALQAADRITITIYVDQVEIVEEQPQPRNPPPPPDIEGLIRKGL